MFLTWTPDALKHYFEIAVDAENALLLRQSALVTDIGVCLEILTAQLSLYDRDKATLGCLKDDIHFLKEACAAKHLDIDFAAVANLRSLSPPHQLSFRERHQNLYWEVRPRIARHEDAQAAGYKFLEDPLALREYRLGKVSAKARFSG